MENEKTTVSIDDLKNDGAVTPTPEKVDRENLKPVDISEIRDYQDNTPGAGEPSVMDEIFSDIDNVIMQKAQDAADVREQINQIESDKKLDAEADGEEYDVIDPANAGRRTFTDEEKSKMMDDIENYLDDAPAEENKAEKKTNTIARVGIDDDDFDKFLSDDEEDDDDSDSISESEMKNMKAEIKSKILPYKNSVDFSNFSISKRHIGVNKIFNEESNKLYVADWVLPSTGKAISMSEFTGTEIEKLNPGNMGRNRANKIKDIYRLIYEHVVDPNKSPSFEVWAKSISFYDIEHLYFAIYKASFEGSNHVPYQCPECNKVFLNEVANIDSMVKYKDDESKAFIESILNKDTSNTSDEYETILTQVSDDIAVALRRPSIFNVSFENAILDEKFTEKYSDLLALLVYIDTVYYINRETNELVEIETNPEPNNLEKTVKRRIVRYVKVIETLTSDQFYELSAKIKDLNDKNDYMEYVLPAATCPHCGKSIEEESKSPEDLLFTRHRLAALANF